MSRVDPPRWTDEQFDEQLADALEAFRDERLREPVEQYLVAFDGYVASVRSLLSETGNLSRLTDASLETLTDPDLLEALRYLAGPPISADDLKTLADASLASNKSCATTRRWPPGSSTPFSPASTPSASRGWPRGARLAITS